MEKKTRKKVEKQMEKTSFFGKPPFLSLLAFITFVNYEHAYLVEKFLHILFSHFALAKKKKETKKKFIETVAVCRVLLDYNLCIAK